MEVLKTRLACPDFGQDFGIRLDSRRAAGPGFLAEEKTARGGAGNTVLQFYGVRRYTFTAP